MAEFNSAWISKKIKREYKSLNIKLTAIITKADKVAASLDNFSLEDFEKLMFNKFSQTKNVNYFYQKKIEINWNPKSISTAKNYRTALRCFQRFHGKKIIDLSEISVEFLRKFENFCIYKEDKSYATVSIYARTMRTIQNDAIRDNAMYESQYCFGKGKYQIPSAQKTKKALSKKKLGLLFSAKPDTVLKQKAKDFWFFAYGCNGINFKDILHLKCKNYDGEVIRFERAKNARNFTKRNDISVYVSDFMHYVFEKYGNVNGNSDDFIFPFLGDSKPSITHHEILKTFISQTNKQFLKFAYDNGITDPISSNWARHTFVTRAVQEGETIAFVAEAVGHTNFKTTTLYFNGFEKKPKKDMSKKLFNFD